MEHLYLVPLPILQEFCSFSLSGSGGGGHMQSLWHPEIKHEEQGAGNECSKSWSRLSVNPAGTKHKNFNKKELPKA